MAVPLPTDGPYVEVWIKEDAARILYDEMLLRPHNERWSDDVLEALRQAGVRPSEEFATAMRRSAS